MSHVRIQRWHLASFASYPAEHADACLKVLARDKDLLEVVASNPALPEGLWLSMWSPRLPVNLACALVSRPLSQAQRNTVFNSELRVKVLSTLVAHSSLSLTEQRLLLGDRVPGAVAEKLLEQGWLDPSLRRQAAVKAGGAALLRELAYDVTSTFTDGVAAKLLSTYSSWAPHGQFRERSLLLKVLLYRRPCLLDIAVGSGDVSLVTAAAGSWKLTGEQAMAVVESATLKDRPCSFREDFSYALLALVNNPVVDLDVVSKVVELAQNGGIAAEQVSSSARRRMTRPAVGKPLEELEDSAEISWLLRRSLPNDYSPGRPLELAMLAVNPSLGDEDRASALNVLAQCDPRFLRCFPELCAQHGSALDLNEEGACPAGPPPLAPELPQWVRQPCQDIVDKLAANAPAWETMVSLLDEFEGPLDELCSLAQAI